MERTQNEQSNGKVVSIFAAKNKRDKEQRETKKEELSVEEIFLAAMKRNEENRQRRAQERSKANKSVLRSYRIKN